MTFSGADDTRGGLTRIAPGAPNRLNEEGVIYDSRGVVLIIGTAALAMPAALQLAESLRVIACVSGASTASSPRANPLVMESRVACLSGHLGSFRASAHGAAGTMIDLAPFSPNADGCFDLVLDFSPQPLLTAPLKPRGYFAPGEEATAIGAAIAEIASLVGRFRKPVYVGYEDELCAHGALGVSGCTRCLAVCPAEAITSKGGRIAVDANLCQGCSTCMLVCPTGALSSKEMPRAALISRLALIAAGPGPLPGLLLHGALEDGAGGTLAAIALPATAAAGIETWLAALALGFPQVTLKLEDDLPASTRRALAAEIDTARAWLAAIGLETGRIRTSAEPAADFAPLAAHTLKASANKRELVNEALAALASAAPEGSAPAAPAPPFAAFGSVEVDGKACTLCLACAPLCPTGALRSDYTAAGNASLHFVEALCVQCGICESACPEDAFTLHARFSPADRHSPRLLAQSAQHCCPDCGKAFISRALLEKSLQFMHAQASIGDNGADGLRYCPMCRMARIQRH